MNSKIKILVGVLVVGLVLIAGWWIWSSQTIKDLKGICGPKGMGTNYNVSYCDKLCDVDNDCKFTCGCGAINKNEICHDEGIIYDCIEHETKCEKGRCVIGREKLPTQEVIITKEQAITIASQTEEFKEFLKLYPDAKVNAMQHCCAEVKVYGGECKCISNPNDNWVVSCYVENEGWEFRYISSVRMAINSNSGEIIAKYPKLEYIKNSEYCEEDGDCLCASCCGGCTNFIHEPLIKTQTESILCYVCSCTTSDNCKCLNNICTAEE